MIVISWLLIDICDCMIFWDNTGSRASLSAKDANHFCGSHLFYWSGMKELWMVIRAHPINLGELWAHPRNIGDCLAWARKRHPILAKPNDKSGMTLKPCTSAQFQRDLKIRNILDTPQKLFGLLCLYHPSVETTRRAGRPLHRSRELPLFPITYVIRCV